LIDSAQESSADSVTPGILNQGGVIAYTINPKWTISAGDLQEGYDWKSDQWVSLPVGFQVGRLVQFGKTTLRLAYNPQYNFRDLDGNPEWTHLFGVGLVVK
jgi:hypothetical protein